MTQTHTQNLFESCVVPTAVSDSLTAVYELMQYLPSLQWLTALINNQ